jgi:Ca2+-binding EF-hand superfamily protein
MKTPFLTSEQRKQLKLGFECFDVQASGWLDLKETRMLLCWLGLNTSKDEIRNIIGEIEQRYYKEGKAPRVQNGMTKTLCDRNIGRFNIELVVEMVEERLKKDDVGSFVKNVFDLFKDDSGRFRMYNASSSRLHYNGFTQKSVLLTGH